MAGTLTIVFLVHYFAGKEKGLFALGLYMRPRVTAFGYCGFHL
jgi:hypothetical protein